MNAKQLGHDERPGRFDAPLTMRTAPRLLLAGIWDGIRLRCPHCREGRLFSAGITVNPYCPECGAPFERPGEGDFVGSVVTAYSITAVVFLAAFTILGLFTNWDLSQRLWASIPIVAVFVVAFYRNMKGFWVAVLVPLLKWMR